MTHCQDWDRYNRDQELQAMGEFAGEVEREMQRRCLMGEVIYCTEEDTILKIAGREVIVPSAEVETLYDGITAVSVVSYLLDIAKVVTGAQMTVDEFYKELDEARRRAQMASDDALYNELEEEKRHMPLLQEPSSP